MLASLVVGVFVATAASPTRPTLEELAGRLRDPATAESALAALVTHGDAAVETLAEDALVARNIGARGWAIVGLGEIGGTRAASVLTFLLEDPSELVRTWAAAARLRAAKDLDELEQLGGILDTVPLAAEAYETRAAELRLSPTLSAEALLALSIEEPTLQGRLQETLIARGSDDLVEVLLAAEVGDVRKAAAALLGARKESSSVATSIVRALRFDPARTSVPWSGGPLFLPGIEWERSDALELAAALIAWDIWCSTTSRVERNRDLLSEKKPVELGVRNDDREDERGKIDAALRGLGPSVGFPTAGDERVSWVARLGETVGPAEARRLLEAQGLGSDPRWTRDLDL